MNTPLFPVTLSSEIADQIDCHFSPMDGIIALTQLRLELPRLHAEARRLLQPGMRRRIHMPVNAAFEWAGVGVTYVEWDERLHIVDVWYRSERPHAEILVTLGDPGPECDPVEVDPSELHDR